MTDVRIVTEPLGGSPLSLALQAGDAPPGWMPAPPTTSSGWAEWARRRRGERDWDAALDALAPALAAGGLAAERLDRVRNGGGVVVTTGQQPGLFGGPLYTWTKAAGAIALADAIEAATGRPALPVFWAATDDADFTEASTTTVARAGGVDVLRALLVPEPGTPMSLAPLGDLRDPLRRLADASGSAADPRPLAAVADAYADPERTVGGAYVALLRALLAPLGMAVLDASHDAVAEAGAPMLRAALDRAAEVERALAARDAEIVAHGYRPQVERVAGLSLVFARESGQKRRVPAGASPPPAARLTPNVLLRPIVERTILPTVAYLAGPGELAYFAQTSVVAAALGVDAPLALPRWSATLIEPDVERLLRARGLALDDLARAGDAESRLARRALSPESAQAIARLRAEIAGVPRSLAATAEATGLVRAVDGAAASLLHRVDRLERRLLAGIQRRERDAMHDVATLRAALRPGGKRQERLLNAIPMLARQGLSLLSELRDAARSHAASLVDRPRSPLGGDRP